MKLFIKLIVFLLVMAVLLPFTIIKGKDGQPLLSFSDLRAPDISLPSLPKSGITIGSSGKTIYRWTDAEGNLNFTNSPPAEGIAYTTNQYDPNQNVIQAVKIPDKNLDVIVINEPSSKKKIHGASDIGSPYSIEKVEKLFEDANNVEQLLKDRLKKQEAMIGQ